MNRQSLKTIALTPADALAAQAARDRKMRAEGMREAANVKYDLRYGKDWLGMSVAILTLADKTEKGEV